ncbi:MAG TPA: MFS transporter [Myxococcota bacterium]|nr:MFS transporter [Myxococcota bacterium]HRY94714.1 MFS transporter [Myxococcota bacterium]HSA22780.1 MFS transporter [Myxococcota bacterium]
MSAERARYPWFAEGDLNGFFSLMLDNVTNLVLLNVILASGFGFPTEFVFTHMIPGTAFGVLVGDLAYTWMARRLARRTGRGDVTAMPLGLDTPSTIGVAVAVLGPVYAASKDPMVTWQVGMATLMLMGVVKLGLAFAGDWVRRVVPQAGLLGSIAGVGVALLGLLPLVNVYKLPVVGLVALGIVLYALVAKLRLPGRLPGAAVAVLAGTALYYLLGATGLLGGAFHLPALTLRFTPPVPTLGFVAGLEQAVDFLPLAIPFGLLTVVGGINVNESARVAGDEYRTRDILLVEAVATLAAGLTGGVAQSTPYIGHPAYKAMGARAGYTLATGLFIGLGGALGLVSFIVDALPDAAVAPILIFVGLEILSQTFAACPRAHYPAIGLAFLPVLASLVMIFVGKFGVRADLLPPHLAAEHAVLVMLANGFILSAMLWGAIGAHLADRRLGAAAAFLGLAAACSLFGVIHSVDPSGRLALPWAAPGPQGLHVAAGYAAVAGLLLLLRAIGPRAPEGTAG